MCCSNHFAEWNISACPVWHPHTAKNIDILERIQQRAAHWLLVVGGIHLVAAGVSPRMIISRNWSGHPFRYVMFIFSSASCMIFYIKEILSPILTIFSYLEILQDHTLSPLELPHHQSTHTDILFCQQSFFMEFYSSCHFANQTVFYSMLLYVVFLFWHWLLCICSFCIAPCSLCVFVLSTGSVCSHVCMMYVYMYVCMYVGEHGYRFILLCYPVIWQNW